MISAAEARQFKERAWQYQLEQIDMAVKETIIAGGHECGYRADLLDERTIEQLRLLGYKVEVADYHFTKISWEE